MRKLLNCFCFLAAAVGVFVFFVDPEIDKRHFIVDTIDLFNDELTPGPLLLPDGKLRTHGWTRNETDIQYVPEHVSPLDPPFSVLNPYRRWALNKYLVTTQKHIIEMVIGQTGLVPFAFVSIYKQTGQRSAENFYYTVKEEGRAHEIFNETDRTRYMTARFDSEKLFLYMRPTGPLTSNVTFNLKELAFYGEFEFIFEPDQESFTSVTPLSTDHRSFQMITIYNVEVAGSYKAERKFMEFCRPGRCSGTVERQIASYPYMTTWVRGFGSMHVGETRLGFWIATGNWDLGAMSSIPHAAFVNGKVCKLLGAEYYNNTEDKTRYYDYYNILNRGEDPGNFQYSFKRHYSEIKKANYGVAKINLELMIGPYVGGFACQDEGGTKIHHIQDKFGVFERFQARW